MSASSTSLEAKAATTASLIAPRDSGLDALRATLTLLVVFHHTAITYGAIGGWYYHEALPDGRPATKLLILFCAVNQAYFMGLFFLIAGYFTPAAAQRHGALAYLKERALRLGLPLLVFGLVIGPITIALAQTAQGRPFIATLLFVLGHGIFENGPLWFTQALLIFCLCYLAWRRLSSRLWMIPQRIAMPAFPSNFVLAATLLLTGAAAFALRLLWPVGVQTFGLQLGYFASYIVLFVAGCCGASGHWLNAVPANQRRLWLILSCVAVPVLPVADALASRIAVLQGNVTGGWNAPAAVYAFWEPLVAWGFILGLLHTFTRRFSRLGPRWTALVRRAYTIFIIHPPVLVAIALAWREVSAPHLVKFAITGTATCVVCFWIAGQLLRVPVIRRVV